MSVHFDQAAALCSLKCGICLDICVDSVETVCCGTLYCEACLSATERKAPFFFPVRKLCVCPNCRSGSSEGKISIRSVEGPIDPNTGCKTVKKALVPETAFEFRPCLPVRRLVEHCCKLPCIHCEKPVLPMEKRKHEEQECPEAPIFCCYKDYGCGVEKTRAEMSEIRYHEEKECKLNPVVARELLLEKAKEKVVYSEEDRTWLREFVRTRVAPLVTEKGKRLIPGISTSSSINKPKKVHCQNKVTVQGEESSCLESSCFPELEEFGNSDVVDARTELYKLSIDLCRELDARGIYFLYSDFEDLDRELRREVVLRRSAEESTKKTNLVGSKDSENHMDPEDNQDQEINIPADSDSSDEAFVCAINHPTLEPVLACRVIDIWSIPHRGFRLYYRRPLKKAIVYLIGKGEEVELRPVREIGKGEEVEIRPVPREINLYDSRSPLEEGRNIGHTTTRNREFSQEERSSTSRRLEDFCWPRVAAIYRRWN